MPLKYFSPTEYHFLAAAKFDNSADARKHTTVHQMIQPHTQIKCVQHVMKIFLQRDMIFASFRDPSLIKRAGLRAEKIT